MILRHPLAARLVPALVVALGLGPGHPPANAPAGPPAWYLEHLQRAMEHGGRTVADNAAYRSAGEPYDAYGIERTWGIGRLSLRARLFALQDGVEVRDLWELRTVWHPGAKEARAYQFGADGTFAVGTLQPLRRSGDPGAGESGVDGLEIVQTFSAPDGSTREIRHESFPLAGGGDEGTSFVREGDAWKPNRSYTWLPAPPGDERED